MIRYVVQLTASMGRHLGEAALAVLIAATVGVLYLGAGLNPPAGTTNTPPDDPAPEK